MMQAPSEFELQHIALDYDPVKAHEYYLRTRKLKGRKAGSGKQPKGFARANQQRHEAAKPRQRRELAAHIQSLQNKLQKLEDRIRELEHKEASEDRKGKAKKERAAKERDKPKSAAEKSKAARESKQYRKKHKQELQTKAKEGSSKSGGGGSKKSSRSNAEKISDLKALRTKVKGQLAVAKQKLAAL